MGHPNVAAMMLPAYNELAQPLLIELAKLHDRGGRIRARAAGATGTSSAIGFIRELDAIGERIGVLQAELTKAKYLAE